MGFLFRKKLSKTNLFKDRSWKYFTANIFKFISRAVGFMMVKLIQQRFDLIFLPKVV